MAPAPPPSGFETWALLILVACAAVLLGAIIFPRWRAVVFPGAKLTPSRLDGLEFSLQVILLLMLAAIGQSVANSLFARAIKSSTDREGLQVAVLGFGLHGCALLAWPAFHLLRRRLRPEDGAGPAADVAGPVRRLGLGRLISAGVLTLLMALPVVALTAAGWALLLQKFGLPDEPQELIGIFRQTHSPFSILTFVFVACVLAPINEELLFRAGLYRFLRRHFGLAAACAVSAVLFGASHLNLASSLPLALFGAALVLAYESTGDIRVPMIAHGLFNLTSILVILFGPAQ